MILPWLIVLSNPLGALIHYAIVNAAHFVAPLIGLVPVP